MVMRTLRVFRGLVIVAVILARALRGQSPQPQTYTLSETSMLTEISIFSGQPANLEVYRDGPRELVELSLPPSDAKEKAFHESILFDFEEHKAYIRMKDRECNWMRYVSAVPPANYDPIGNSAEFLEQIKVRPIVSGEGTINGIPARIEEILDSPLSELGFKTGKVWISRSGNYVVKLESTSPERTITWLEVKKLSFDKPMASLFVKPANCAQTEGEWSSTGMSVQYKGTLKATEQGSLSIAPGANAKSIAGPSSIASSPAPASPSVRKPRVYTEDDLLQLRAASGATITNSTSAEARCLQGYVWREASPTDHVCVTPETRQQTFGDNAAASQRHEPGSDICVQGYVWREAFLGDHVCVSPVARSQARSDNAQAGSRTEPAQLAAGTITGISLQAVPDTFRGSCPATIRFEGEIRVTGPATITYRFVRSDNATGPIQTITADRAGSLPVLTEWHLGGLGSSYSGWEQLIVLNQSGASSGQARFSLACQ